MGKDEFQFSAPDLINLRSLWKRAPKKMRAVSAGVLNSQAFALKKIILRVLDDEIIIRRSGFVKRQVKVDKARSVPIDRQVAEAGSVFAKGFDGWEELEFGDRGKQKFVATRFARGGGWEGRIKPRFKVNRANPPKRISDFRIENARDKQHRLVIFLNIMRTRKESFAIPRKIGAMEPGTKYIFNNGRIKSISRPKTKKSRRIKWMTKSINLLTREVNILKLWEKNFKFIFRLR